MTRLPPSGPALTRRAFLRQTAVATAAVGLPCFLRPEYAGAAKRPGGSPLLVVVFLRGGADGLSLLPNQADPELAKARHALLAPEPLPFGDGPFALHPALGALAPHAEYLGAVCAVGMDRAQRSHFEAQDWCERGGAPVHARTPGWLARALAAGASPTTLFRAVAARKGRPLALSGDPQALAFDSLDRLRIRGSRPVVEQALGQLFARGEGPSAPAARAGRDALEAIAALERLAQRSFPGEARFRGRFGQQLATVARLAHADLGLAAAWVDAGGWDTHIGQGAESGALARAATQLAEGLDAFTRSLESRLDDVLVLVVTEFGRTIAPNGSGGSDHGRASVAFALGGRVAGAQVQGRWPGAHPDAREDGRDLRVTTDLRHVLAEGARHLGCNSLASVFPGFDARAPFLVSQSRSARPR